MSSKKHALIVPSANHIPAPLIGGQPKPTGLQGDKSWPRESDGTDDAVTTAICRLRAVRRALTEPGRQGFSFGQQDPIDKRCRQ